MHVTSQDATSAIHHDATHVIRHHTQPWFIHWTHRPDRPAVTDIPAEAARFTPARANAVHRGLADPAAWTVRHYLQCRPESRP